MTVRELLALHPDPFGLRIKTQDGVVFVLGSTRGGVDYGSITARTRDGTAFSYHNDYEVELLPDPRVAGLVAALREARAVCADLKDGEVDPADPADRAIACEACVTIDAALVAAREVP